VILKDSHSDIRFDIFERLNSGGTPLNHQELRNSMYRGRLNDLVRQLSEDPVFMKVRGASAPEKRMRDCELVLRFFAFHYRLQTYRSDFARFLDRYLRDGMKLNELAFKEHETSFRRMIGDVFYVFSEYGFRRFAKGSWEKVVNRALYDVVALSFALLDSEDIRAHKMQIIEQLQLLCQDSQFSKALTSSTTDKGPLQMRLETWRGALLNIGLEIPHFRVGE
jgi:hypothetical protein